MDVGDYLSVKGWSTPLVAWAFIKQVQLMKGQVFPVKNGAASKERGTRVAVRCCQSPLGGEAVGTSSGKGPAGIKPWEVVLIQKSKEEPCSKAQRGKGENLLGALMHGGLRN